MSSRRTGARALGLWMAALAAACGDDPAPTPATDASGAEEAGADSDAGAGDAGAGDGGAGDGGARLSATGLYADIGGDVLSEDVRAYVPQGVLWADEAEKRRWLYLPPDSTIDTTDMDQWVYPVGTKIWKEFSIAGTKLETRLIEKTDEETWNLVAYQWLEDGSDAVAVPKGAKRVFGTDHDIPGTKDCQACHDGRADTVLGFTALQLSWGDAGVSLDDLVRENRLSTPPSAPLVLPGDTTAQTALIYLHANCGHCHNETTRIADVTDVNYWLHVDALERVEDTTSFHTIARDLSKNGGIDASDLLKRMRFRGQGQMPALGTKHVDEDGVARVRAWLDDAAFLSPQP